MLAYWEKPRLGALLLGIILFYILLISKTFFPTFFFKVSIVTYLPRATSYLRLALKASTRFFTWFIYCGDTGPVGIKAALYILYIEFTSVIKALSTNPRPYLICFPYI